MNAVNGSNGAVHLAVSEPEPVVCEHCRPILERLLIAVATEQLRPVLEMVGPVTTQPN